MTLLHKTILKVKYLEHKLLISELNEHKYSSLLKIETNMEAQSVLLER